MYLSTTALQTLIALITLFVVNLISSIAAAFYILTSRGPLEPSLVTLFDPFYSSNLYLRLILLGYNSLLAFSVSEGKLLVYVLDYYISILLRSVFCLSLTNSTKSVTRIR